VVDNPSGFKITDATVGLNRTDFNDVFINKSCFQEGGLWLWGWPSGGKLGDNTNTTKFSPVQTVSGGVNWKQVIIGYTHTAAVKTDGSLWTWGFSTAGQLGRNNIVNASSPVQTISAGTNWKSVSIGGAHTGALKADGTLWVWGLSSSGQIGNNAILSMSSPVQTVSGGSSWKKISLAGSHSAAIKTDGTLWLWGNGNSGRLGNNSILNRSSPVQTISGGTNWKHVSATGLFSAGIKNDSTLWLWGVGINGQLGDNRVGLRSSPVQTISEGTNWKQVGTGYDHTAAIKIDGTLWLWGKSSFGQIGGNNGVQSVSSPVQTVSGGTNWKQTSVGYSHSAAIKTDGTLWTWGAGAYGALGNNSSLSQSSPVQTISGGTSWLSVCMQGGAISTSAIKDSGTIF